ncbi:MAG: ZIP family metal transporter [Candidatus Omnitrophica bacterium]|nr:ZIP family metal transporter [Candidatus Omnitrophota bacterium]MCM8825395.1 ZIP family metal transporter [Candidatus Omnitrophota bacterium]
MEWLQNFNTAVLALLAGIFTWVMTAIGSSFVFISKRFNQKVFDTMLGFAAGVMIAASFWSLLNPAIEMSGHLKFFAWFPAGSGFFLGALLLRFADRILPHLHLGYPDSEAEGIKTNLSHTTLLIFAITLHNIPEGLAVGVAIGAASYGLPEATFAGAVGLAVGIGIQNMPEGFAVSISMRRDGSSRLKSFMYGQLSAVVEPLFAVIGAIGVMFAKPLLPYSMGFAAGAMIFVVIEELIPESQKNNNIHLSTAGTIAGFLAMMILDVAFG